MKILCYMDGLGTVDSRGNGYSICSFSHFFAQHFANALSEHNNVEIKLLLSQSCLDQYDEFTLKGTPPDVSVDDVQAVSRLFAKAERIVLAEEDIRACFEGFVSLWEIYLKDFERAISPEAEEKLKILMLKSLAGWRPDIVVVYPLNLNFVRKLFNGALVFVTENGIFSRDPLPTSSYFDAVGSLDNNIMNQFQEKLHGFSLTKEEDLQVENFKKAIQKYFLNKYNIKNIILPIKKQWRKLILVPLVGSFRAGTMSSFPDDATIIQYIMENVPNDVGVIFTEHYGMNSLTCGYLVHYQRKYKNFIFLPQLQKIGMASVPLFPYIDAIINHYSMTGTMAMLWDIPLIPLCGHYNNWQKDCNSLNDLESVLAHGKCKKNTLIYWYFTRYAIFEKRFSDSAFLYNFFAHKLERFRAEGISLDMYEQIESFGEISEYIIAYLEQGGVRKNPKKSMSKRVIAEAGRAIRKLGYSLQRFGQYLIYVKNR